MLIDSKDYSSDKLYFLMTQIIIPRPIAWVLSDNGNGNYNLAPYSFFNAITSNPPIVMISAGWKDETIKKDTWRNIEERNHFVIHIPSADSAKDVVASSEMLAHGESEIVKNNLKLVKESSWTLPRLESSKVSLYCTKYAIYEIGQDPQALILGEIKGMWIDDQLISMDGHKLKIDAKALNPLARLGGSEYSLIGEKFTIQRPK